MKPTYSVVVDKMEATFTDTYNDPTSRIMQFDFGDGTLFRWDMPNQTVVTHTYKKIGTFYTTALNSRYEMSDTVTVVISGSPPVPVVESWWTRFIKWLKGVLKWK